MLLKYTYIQIYIYTNFDDVTILDIQTTSQVIWSSK